MSSGSPGEVGPEEGEDEDDAGSDAEVLKVDLHGTPLPDECLRALDLVRYLAQQNGYNGVFAATRSKPLDEKRVLARVSPDGLTIVDVNDGSNQHFSPRAIESQLRQRNGRAFLRLAHLGHIYWLPSQYSKASCQQGDSKMKIYLATWYELEFERRGLEYVLSRINYVEREGH